MAHTITCQSRLTRFINLVPSNRHLIDLAKLRYDASRILKAANAKGTFFFSALFLRFARYYLIILMVPHQTGTIVSISPSSLFVLLNLRGRLVGCIYSEDNVKRVKYAYDNGHQVASHTWAHNDLTKLSWDQSRAFPLLNVSISNS